MLILSCSKKKVNPPQKIFKFLPFAQSRGAEFVQCDGLRAEKNLLRAYV